MIDGLVSTIIPVFNRAVMLREAVESVLAQTHRPIEVIIVDDGSTDETPEVAAELALRWPDEVRCVRQQNAGPGPARNRGLAEARGEFVQYLDSDDLLLPEKFKRQVRDLRRHLDCGVSYCIASRPDSHDSHAVSHRTGECFDRILPDFLHQRGWHTISPLWRRTACDRIGPWSALRVMEDWEYDCRAGIIEVRPAHTAEVLCCVRDHGEDRASGAAGGYNRQQWADYLTAHESVYEQLKATEQLHHLRAVPFAKNLFRVVRTCAICGFIEEARRAYHLVQRVPGVQGQQLKLALFRICAFALGWRAAAATLERLYRIMCDSVAWTVSGRVACWTDRFRERTAGRKPPRVD